VEPSARSGTGLDLAKHLFPSRLLQPRRRHSGLELPGQLLTAQLMDFPQGKAFARQDRANLTHLGIVAAVRELKGPLDEFAVRHESEA